MRSVVAALTLVISVHAGATGNSRQCGDEGVWLQILGAGGPELDDGHAGPGYLVWMDDRARLLVETGAGTAAGFDRSGAAFADLDAIAFTNLQAHHTSDLPAFIRGSEFSQRDRPLTLLGPDAASDSGHVDTQTFIERLIGPNGAYPALAGFLTYRSDGGYKITTRNVPSTGQRRWARFGTENIRLSSIPVHYGTVPAVAWRVEIGTHAIVFTGNFNNEKNVVPEFAGGADAIVFHHAIHQSSRGNLRDLYVTPRQMGAIAKQAGARMIVLGHRMNRTRGRETQSREAIEANYDGSIIFANDLECWGL